MLFHVTHTHEPDVCPYHDPGRIRDRLGRLVDDTGNTGARLLGAWVDPAGHALFFVIDAASAEEIEEVLAPMIDAGRAEVRPVAEAGDFLRRRTG